MATITIEQQNTLLQNREKVLSEIKKYPNVINVGVGLKEVNHQLTPVLCYRVYVSEKKPPVSLKEEERIPATIDGFITDVITYGVVEEAADIKPVRPLKGGLPIKNDLYEDKDHNKIRGGGTLGCLAILNDGSEKIVGLTNHHVVAWNSSDKNPEVAKHKIGQPWRATCCCCERNIIGKVLKAQKNAQVDCAIIELHDDIITDIKNNSSVNEIDGVGFIMGKAIAVAGENTPVKKSGAATKVTHGIISDIAFDNNQLLISPATFGQPFAGFGDSGAIVLNEQNFVIGLLWGMKRDRIHNPGEPLEVVTDALPLGLRTHGVATPIDAVELALGIKIPIPPAVVPTILIHPDDTKTHGVPSSLPIAQHPKRHLVTVKGEGDILLSVTFDQPVDQSRIKWVSDNPDMPIAGPGPSNDNSTARISRKVPKGTKAMIGVTVDGYGVGEKVFLWIVWSAPDQADIPALPTETIILPGSTTISRSFRIKYTIQPAEIINTQMDQHDLPDLRGPNSIPPPNVPDTDTGVFFKGNDLSGGARVKWDGSVRLRCKSSHGGAIFLTGGFHDVNPNYPSLPTVGNFDTVSFSIYGDPYTTSDLGEIGKIFDDTVIAYSVERNVGDLNNKIAAKIQIQQFARLELAGHWYVISDSFPWRLDIKLIKASEVLDNIDYDGDGIKQGDDWIAESITVAQDNNDF